MGGQGLSKCPAQKASVFIDMLPNGRKDIYGWTILFFHLSLKVPQNPIYMSAISHETYVLSISRFTGIHCEFLKFSWTAPLFIEFRETGVVEKR